MYSMKYLGGDPGIHLNGKMGKRGALGNIQYLGALSSQSANASYAIDLTSLSLLPNDLILMITGKCEGSGGAGGSSTIGITTADYTRIRDVGVVNDTRDANAIVAYKFMGSPVDGDVTVTRAATATQGGCTVVMAFRGVNLLNPIDAALVNLNSLNTANILPPEITTVTANAIVVSGGVGTTAASPTGVISTAPANALAYKQEFMPASGGGLNAILAYYLRASSGAFTPDQILNSATSTSDSSISFSVALRPA